MRLPGEAQLEFVVAPVPGRARRSRLVETGRVAPRGLLGIAYWYAVVPFHRIVFGRMLDGIRRAAERGQLAPIRAV